MVRGRGLVRHGGELHAQHFALRPAFPRRFTGLRLGLLVAEDRCAAGEYRPKEPKSGGTSGLLNSTAWAETGICVKIPIAKLQAAAADLSVMTWGGTTKIAGSKKLPTTRPNDLFRVKVTYEARHKHLWCRWAQWPMEWTARVIDGTKVAPDRIYVDTDRVPGGDGNGAYVKRMSARIELLRHSDNKTSLHMRYEVRAPSQEPSWPLGRSPNTPIVSRK